ncbi:MAG: 3-oxoacyl-[acyl-carrier-protein] reductase [Chlamydiia bacterium]
MRLDLEGRTALITGATSGIGKAIALALAAEGVKSVLVGTSAERGAEIAARIAAEYGIQAIFMRCDVADTAAVQQLCGDAWAALGQIDFLINCAGVTQDSLLMKMDEACWDRVLDVNLKSIYNFCQSLVRPMMKARQGSIVNMSSVVGLVGNAGQTHYAAAKAGMIGFTKALAKEVAPRGLRVNCIAPGWIETPMTQNLTEAQRQAVNGMIPLQRFGAPEEVAATAVFLCSAAASYITGQVLTVDGGMVMTS